MPHVSAVITNLALTHAGRSCRMRCPARWCGGGAPARREQLRLRGRARAAGEHLAPLPSLFIVVDEFSEMLSAKPSSSTFSSLGRNKPVAQALAIATAGGGRLRNLGRTPTGSTRALPPGSRAPCSMFPTPRPAADARVTTSSPQSRRCCGSGGVRLRSTPRARKPHGARDKPGVLEDPAWTITGVQLPALGAGAGAVPTTSAASDERGVAAGRRRRLHGSLGPAAHQVGCRRWTSRTRSTSDVTSRARLGLVSRVARARRLTVPPRHGRSPARQRRDILTVACRWTGATAIVGDHHRQTRLGRELPTCL
jgi:S-DNA-T family DNA segregation ATPase FtsK/SpoIIIE